MSRDLRDKTESVATSRGAPPEPLRVVHVVAPARYGGLERVVQALSAGQAAAGERVQVVAILERRGEHPFVSAVRSAGVRVAVLRMPRRGYINEYRQLRELIREVTPDVVHTHGYRPDILASRAARAERVPVVATSHGFSYGAWRNRLYEWLQRRAFRSFDAVVAVSRPMSEMLRSAGVPARLLHVVPNGLSDEVVYDRARARELLGIPAEAFRIGWVGRFAWAKAVDIFIESVALIQDVPWTASIIGTGEGEAEARALAERLGVAARIQWHGYVADAGHSLAAFDAMVISSRTEGTPISLLEAMRAQVPLITTSVGGIPDVVSEAHAWLVPPHDPNAIAAAVRDVWSRPTERVTRTAAAFNRLRSFGVEQWVESYERVYRSVLGSTSA